METIDEVVRNVFDDKTAEMILESYKDSSSEKLDERLQMFTDTLSKILGVGSIIIQDLILESLYSKFGLELQRKKDYTFAEYILELAIKRHG